MATPILVQSKSLDQNTTGTTIASPAFTVASATVGNVIVVAVVAGSAAVGTNLSAVTCADNKGNTYTKQVSALAGTAKTFSTDTVIFTAPITTGGAGLVATVSGMAGMTESVITTMEWSNVAATIPDGTQTKIDNAGGTNPALSVTTTVAGDVCVVAGGTGDSGGTATHQAANTQVTLTNTNTVFSIVEYKTFASSGVNSITLGIGGNGSYTGGAALALRANAVVTTIPGTNPLQYLRNIVVPLSIIAQSTALVNPPPAPPQAPFRPVITQLAYVTSPIQAQSRQSLALTGAPSAPVPFQAGVTQGLQPAAPIAQAAAFNVLPLRGNIGPFTNLQAQLANITVPLAVAPATKVPASTAVAAPFTPTPITLAPITLTLGAQSVSLPFGLNGVVTPSSPFLASNTQLGFVTTPLRLDNNTPLPPAPVVFTPFTPATSATLAQAILPLTPAAYNPTLIDVSIRQFLLLTTKSQAQLSSSIAPIPQATSLNFALQNQPVITQAPFASSTTALAFITTPLPSTQQSLPFGLNGVVTPAQPFASGNAGILVTAFTPSATNSQSLALTTTPPVAAPFATTPQQLAPTFATLTAAQSNYALQNTPINTTQPFASSSTLLAPITYTLPAQQVSLSFGLNGVVTPVAPDVALIPLGNIGPWRDDDQERHRQKHFRDIADAEHELRDGIAALVRGDKPEALDAFDRAIENVEAAQDQATPYFASQLEILRADIAKLTTMAAIRQTQVRHAADHAARIQQMMDDDEAITILLLN